MEEAKEIAQSTIAQSQYPNNIGPTNPFTVYYGETLHRGKFSFSSAYSNFGRVYANVDLNEVPLSFNGGISGIGGSFFGLEYSTNNLLGRGKTLSFNLAYGNRQRSFQFSFTEPYINNRPITVGFSVFAFSQKYFGEGTFLSSNQEAQQGLFGSSLDFLNVDEENLFTRESYGASIFASAPLSEFTKKTSFSQLSRVGLSYQISQTSVTDPEVNQDPSSTQFIPTIYGQPNILTSRIAGTFAYDSRGFAKDPNDPVRGRSVSASVALSGLGGDVRTYAPQISFTQYYPVRRKGRDQQPEVFGFRLVAANIGSFAVKQKIRDSASLAFIDGIPIYERFFLGDEFTIRGYNVRSISPVAPMDKFITSSGVVLAANPTGVNHVPRVFVPGRGIVPATYVQSTASSLIESEDANGFIGQFWIGRRNTRTPEFLPNQPPTVKLLASQGTITLPCPPRTSSTTCTPSASQTIQLSANATDPDGDTLLYTYTTTGGRVTGDGANVSWDLSGVQPGTYTATVEVDDGVGCVAFSSTTVTIAECRNCEQLPTRQESSCPNTHKQDTSFTSTGAPVIKAPDELLARSHYKMPLKIQRTSSFLG